MASLYVKSKNPIITGSDRHRKVMEKILYRLLKVYTRTALKFYFRKWQIRFLSPLPEGPVLLVSNHQNAFLDALLVVCGSRRNPWFLTRANIFNNPATRRLIHFLKMTPVYRFRDGFGSLRKNDEVVDNCVKLFQQGECVLVFAEGNHDDHWTLRAMQKGFARIAWAAEERSNWKMDLKIVPVGIQYESVAKDFRSRVLLTFGHAIPVKSLIPPGATQAEAINGMMERLSIELEKLILHIEPGTYEEKVRYLERHRRYHADLADQLHADKKILQGYKAEDVASRKKPAPLSKWWSPVFIYSFVNHILPWAVIQWVLKKKVTDAQFISSIRFAVGMVVVPLAYLIQAAVCYELSGSWPLTLGYFISLPLSVALRTR